MATQIEHSNTGLSTLDGQSAAFVITDKTKGRQRSLGLGRSDVLDCEHTSCHGEILFLFLGKKNLFFPSKKTNTKMGACGLTHIC
jgi:hypothetical protein